MDRRTFLKTLASLGASIALPLDVVAATEPEIDAAWATASRAWGLFEVSDYGTLSLANFEAPKTRAEAYWLDVRDLSSASDVEAHWSLRERIVEHYRDLLWERANKASLRAEENDQPFEWPDLDAQAEEGWEAWLDGLAEGDRADVDSIVEDWLAEEPDWCLEADELYKTGNAQGAAYDHFLSEDREVMEALDIVVIEGEFPGSSYYAAELRIPVEEANRIAAAKGWEIRFVEEGSA